jgi:hypothetical protein
MTGQLEPEVAEIGVRLLDDAYMAWFAAESECEQALRAWFDGTSGNRARAYFAYRAALDREEAAAHDLQRLGALVQPCRDSLVARDKGEAVRADPNKEWLS